MKKKKIIKQLLQRVENLEKQIKPNSITFFDPNEKNKSVVVGIIDGSFSQDVHLNNTKIEIINITKQSI